MTVSAEHFLAIARELEELGPEAGLEVYLTRGHAAIVDANGSNVVTLELVDGGAVEVS